MLIYTRHAQARMTQRNIPISWVERAVREPDQATPDPKDPELTRAFKAIAEFENRVLRVVHRPEGADTLIVSVFFDRRAK